MIKLGKGFATPLATLATGIVTYIFLWICFKDASIPWGPDTENILAPLFFDVSRSIHHYGLLAGLYDPGQVSGLSLSNTPYFNPYYPLYFNWLGSDTSIFDTMVRLKIVDLLHLSIYASGSYLLCRSISVRHWLALAVGLSSPWFPAVHSLLNWPQILASFAWIPWVVACQLFLYRNPRLPAKIAATTMLGITFSLLVYAQPAQNMILAIVGSAVIWLTALVSSRRTTDQEKRRNFHQTTFSLAIAGVIAILLCGSYLIDVTIYLSKAIRWVGSEGAIIGMHRLPLRALREYAFHWRDVARLVVYTPGTPTVPGDLYIGAPLTISALLLYTANKRDRIVNILLISTTIIFAFCFAFFAPILQWLPVANKVRELSWWSCYVVVIMTPLAAYGLQNLLNLHSLQDNNGQNIHANHRLSVVIVSGCCVAAFIPILLGHQINALNIFMTLIGLGLLLGGIAYPAMKEHFRQLAGVLVIASCVATPAYIYIKYLPERPLLTDAEHVKTREEATKIASLITDRDNFRFAVNPKLPNFKNFTVTLANLDLRGIRGDLSPQENDKFRLLFFPTQEVADLYGVKYEILPSQESQPSDVSIDQNLSLRINARALPRIFFVQGGVKVVKSPIDALLNVSNPGTWHFFVASHDLPRGLDFSPYAAGDPTIVRPDITENTPVTIRVSLLSNEPGLLVLNEDPAARWRATLDGTPVKPIRINGFQTAFPVAQAGHHQLEIERPTRLF